MTDAKHVRSAVLDSDQPHTCPNKLAELTEKVRQLQEKRRGPLEHVPSGWARLDEALGGGFVRGAVHELIAGADGAPTRTLALLIAAQAMRRRTEVIRPNQGTEGPRDRGVEGAGRGAQGAGRGAQGAGSARHGSSYGKSAPCVKKSIVCSRERTQRHQTDDPGFSTLRTDKWLLVLDTQADFYPPGAAQLGVPLSRLLVVRVRRTGEALWVCEQALRCPAIAAVIAALPALDSTASRRLQLAAEAGGGLGLLLQRNAKGHSFAASRLGIEPVRTAPAAGDNERRGDVEGRAADKGCGHGEWRSAGPIIAGRAGDDLFGTWRVRISILKRREGRPRKPFVLDLISREVATAADERASTRSDVERLRRWNHAG